MKRIASLFVASCAETARHLSEHLDGELRGLRRIRVARHLGECPRCRAVYETLLRTVSGVRALGSELPPEEPELADAVVRRIEATP